MLVEQHMQCRFVTNEQQKNELQFLKVLLLQTGMITCIFILCKIES